MTTSSFDPDNKKTAIFLKNSDQGKIQMVTFLEGLQRHAPQLWRRALDPLQEFYLYFSSARDGLLEIPLMRTLVKQRRTMKEFTLICQGVSPLMRRAFQHNALLAGVSELVQEYQIVPFEEPLYVPPRVHVSIGAYEWDDIKYWKETPQEHHTLVKFKKTLHLGGIGLLIFRFQGGDVASLHQALQSLTADSFPLVYGEEVVEELSRLQIRHQAYIVDTVVTVNACFQEERFQPNKEGEALLSFMLQTEWDLLPDQVKYGLGEQLAKIRNGNRGSKINLQQLYIWIFPDVARKSNPRRYER